MSSTVKAISATNDVVYLGGSFSAVGSTGRSKLAAVRASDGGLLPWKPVATGGSVNALILSPDRTKVVAGGAFTALNGSNAPGFGLGAVDAVSGKSLPTPVNDVVRNAGSEAAITSLSSDGTSWYGTALYSHHRTAGPGTWRAPSPPTGPTWTSNGSTTAAAIRTASSETRRPCTRQATLTTARRSMVSRKQRPRNGTGRLAYSKEATGTHDQGKHQASQLCRRTHTDAARLVPGYGYGYGHRPEPGPVVC